MPAETRILVTVLSVVAALALTGFVSAKIGLSPRLPAVLRSARQLLGLWWRMVVRRREA